MEKKLDILNENGLDNLGNIIVSKQPRVDGKKRKSHSTTDGIKTMKQVVKRSREQLITDLNEDILGTSPALPATAVPSTSGTTSSSNLILDIPEVITDGVQEGNTIENESNEQGVKQITPDTQHQPDRSDSMSSLLSSLKSEYKKKVFFN